MKMEIIRFIITNILTPSNLFLLQKLVVLQQATNIEVLYCLFFKHVGACQYLPRSQRGACSSWNCHTFRHTYVYTCACHGSKSRHVYAPINSILFRTMCTIWIFIKFIFEDGFIWVFRWKSRKVGEWEEFECVHNSSDTC